MNTSMVRWPKKVYDTEIEFFRVRPSQKSLTQFMWITAKVAGEATRTSNHRTTRVSNKLRGSCDSRRDVLLLAKSEIAMTNCTFSCSWLQYLASLLLSHSFFSTVERLLWETSANSRQHVCFTWWSQAMIRLRASHFAKRQLLIFAIIMHVKLILLR